MINLSQWRASIGYFNSRVNCYIDREFISSTNNIVLLYTVMTVMRDVAVLLTYMYVVTVLLLLCCGDVEINPGPVHKVCPNCNINCHIRKKSCECGYVFYNKCGRKIGSTHSAGFSVSSGRPSSNASIIDLDIQKGRPASNAYVNLDVHKGRPSSTTEVDLNVQRGRPSSNVDIQLDVPTRQTFDITYDAGFSVTTSCPLVQNLAILMLHNMLTV